MGDDCGTAVEVFDKVDTTEMLDFFLCTNRLDDGLAPASEGEEESDDSESADAFLPIRDGDVLSWFDAPIAGTALPPRLEGEKIGFPAFTSSVKLLMNEEPCSHDSQ